MSCSRRRFLKSTGAAAALSTWPLRSFPLRAAVATALHPCFLHSGSGYAPFIERFVKHIQPGSDDFLGEKYAAELAGELTSWREALLSSTRDLSAVGQTLAETLDASLLNRVRITELRSGPPVRSSRADFDPSTRVSGEAVIGGFKEYLAAFSSLDIAELEIGSIEIVRGEPAALKTAVYYDLIGRTGANRKEERTGEWEFSWLQTSAGKWQITAWKADAESRVELSGAGFTDVSATAFGSMDSYRAQMSQGLDYWRTTLDGATGIDIYGNNGLCVGDFDSDGHDDIYVCQPAGLPNRLYRNRGDGTFTDVTEAAGVGLLDGTSAAIFADLTNSGRQDLIVVRHSGPLLFVNLGNGSFQIKPDAFNFARPPQGTFTGVSVADYDRDGLLDVYFCTYSFYQGLSEYEFPKPYYDAQNGPPNFLLKNRGGHAFDDVTIPSGIDVNNNRFSFASVWNDYDRDGWPDLFVVNDFGRKVLYKNNRNGTFTDVSAEAGVEDPGEGMSMTWFDYDNDGYDDIYSVNMWEAAGRRVTRQPAFMPTAPEEIKHLFWRDAAGNSLLHNQGGHAGAASKFRDVTEESGTRAGGWNWGSEAWDFDHDGYADLYIVNGFISGANPEDLSSFYWRQVAARSLDSGGQSKDYADAWSAINEFIRSDYSWSGRQRNNFYLNNRNATFSEAAGLLGLDCLEDGRSFVLSDLDGDGRLEVILKNRTAPQLRAFHNDLDPLGPAIAFSLRGTKSNRDAIGASIEVITQHGAQRKTLRAGSGFLSQNTKLLHFGLGASEGPVKVTIEWPNGTRQTLEDIPVNHRVEVQENTAGFHVQPFRLSPRTSAAPAKPPSDPPPATAATWLMEPILPPPFSLPDQHGTVRALSDAKGSAQLLVFWSSNCGESREYLDQLNMMIEKQQGNLKVLSILFTEPGQEQAPWVNQLLPRLSFPVLTPEEKTFTLYNIFHRYLFDRRQPLSSPATFLLDGDGKVVRTYSGAVDVAHLLDDMKTMPGTAEQRLQRGLPFPGRYFRGQLHHNYFTYGVAYLQYEFFDEALQAFEEAIRNGDTSGAVYYNVGLIYLNKGAFEDARRNLEKAVEFDPANADAWNNLGVVHGQQGDYSRAQSEWEKANQLHPGHLLAIQNLVKLYRYQGRDKEAQTLLEEAVAKDPLQAQLHQGLAMLFVESKDLGKAKSEFEEAARLEPRNVEILNGLGVVLMEAGESDEAMQRFSMCRELAPDYDRPYLNMAVLYVSAGHPEKARELLSEFLAKQPDNAEIRQALQEVDNRQ